MLVMSKVKIKFVRRTRVNNVSVIFDSSKGESFSAKKYGQIHMDLCLSVFIVSECYIK